MPCIVQDWRTGEVLTLAYMNAEALRRTRETGEIHFFSRSRQELWHKGATSGNTQAVQGDPLRLRRRRAAGAGRARRPRLPHGRADLLSPRRARAARRPTSRSRARAHDRRARSRSARGLLHGALLADPSSAGEKVQEEAEEVARAAREESDERVAEEAADVLYHLTVLLRGRGPDLADAERVLDGRRQR